MIVLLHDKAATEDTGGIQLVDVLVWRVQDSFIPPYVLGLEGMAVGWMHPDETETRELTRGLPS